MKRTHDLIYLKENNQLVKEIFILAANIATQKEFTSIGDVGCATGAFPGYLKQRFPNCEVTGIEYVDQLLKKAKVDFPQISFIKGNVLERSSVTKKFDLITLIGTLCLFDDYETVLNNVLSWIIPGGRLIIGNMISEYDFDIFVKYKKSNEKNVSTELESGWNIISKKSLELVAKKNHAKLISCIDFEPKIELVKREDLMRSWTEKNLSGGNDLFNATHLRQPIKLALIEKLP